MDDCEKAIRKNAEKRTVLRHFFHIYLKELRETQTFLIWITLWVQNQTQKFHKHKAGVKELHYL